MNHIHVSTVTALTVFLMVLLVGAFYRWLSMRLASSDSSTAQSIAGAMAFAY
jgi:hypothetical protein